MDEPQVIKLWAGQRVKVDPGRAAEAGTWLVTEPRAAGSYIGIRFIDGIHPSKLDQLPLDAFFAHNPQLLDGQLLLHPSAEGEWRVVEALSGHTTVERDAQLDSVATGDLIHHNLERLRIRLQYDPDS